MKITLEKNTGDGATTVPYTALTEIVTATIDAGTTFKVPMHVEFLGQSKLYYAEPCGFRVEGDKPELVAAKLGHLLPSLISTARFPSYVFVARSAGYHFPVYTIGHEVFATTPGGPQFRHVELAKVREYLTDYLNTIGILGNGSQDDKLHVRGVDTTTLEMIRPLFYLKKRIEGQTDFWAPVFFSAETKTNQATVYTYAASARRAAPYDAALGILALRDIVAAALIDDKRLNASYDLRIDRIFAETWAELQAYLGSESAEITISSITLPVYTAPDGLYIAAEKRVDENRYNLYLGTTLENVKASITRNFVRRGI
ncbi:MAG: hypothetical protein M9928_20170 [Anaerolineae bacterium]|nr:hypothetical protein [Anaerolineae bacterium]